MTECSFLVEHQEITNLFVQNKGQACNWMFYTKKCRAAACYHCHSFPCLQVPAFQKGSGGESWSLNFHIWLLLEEHVEQLTGWCNPIRPHSYACYHHSALRGEGSPGQHIHTLTNALHTLHSFHTFSSPHLLDKHVNKASSQSLPDWLQKRQTYKTSLLPGMLACLSSLRHNRCAPDVTDISKCR